MSIVIGTLADPIQKLGWKMVYLVCLARGGDKVMLGFWATHPKAVIIERTMKAGGWIDRAPATVENVIMYFPKSGTAGEINKNITAMAVWEFRQTLSSLAMGQLIPVSRSV